jgi:hypothetical protein
MVASLFSRNDYCEKPNFCLTVKNWTTSNGVFYTTIQATTANDLPADTAPCLANRSCHLSEIPVQVSPGGSGLYLIMEVDSSTVCQGKGGH